MGDSDVQNPWDKSEKIRKETVTFSPGLVFYPSRGRPRRIHNTYPLPPLSLRMDGSASDLRTSASRSTVRFRCHQSVLCVSARIRSHALVARRRQRRRWSGQRPSRRQSLPDRLFARWRGGEVFTFATYAVCVSIYDIFAHLLSCQIRLSTSTTTNLPSFTEL